MNITVNVDLVFDRQHRQDETYFIKTDSVLYMVILGCACGTLTEISVVTACSVTTSKRTGAYTKIDYYITKVMERVFFWEYRFLHNWQTSILHHCPCSNTQFELIPTGQPHYPQPGVKVVIAEGNKKFL